MRWTGSRCGNNRTFLLRQHLVGGAAEDVPEDVTDVVGVRPA
jgi:hypothetical protein